MIDHLGLSRMAVLLVVALVIYGPERLPGLAFQWGQALRKFRRTLDAMSSELRASVGPEFDLTSLDPRAFMAELMAEDAVAPTVGTNPGSTADVDLDAAIPVEWWHELPRGSDAMTLLTNPIDLSQVERELSAALTSMAPPVDLTKMPQGQPALAPAARPHSNT